MGSHPHPTVIFIHLMVTSTDYKALKLYFYLFLQCFFLVHLWQSDSQKFIMMWRCNPNANGSFASPCQEGSYFKYWFPLRLIQYFCFNGECESPYDRTNVLFLAAAWLVVRKEFLVSFLVMQNSYLRNYHNAW